MIKYMTILILSYMTNIYDEIYDNSHIVIYST